jgi:hypothetical protein
MLVGHTGNHQRLGRRFATKKKPHIFWYRNLQNYAEDGVAVQVQNAAKASTMDRCAWVGSK